MSQVGPETLVRMKYVARDADGQAVLGGEGEVAFVFGYGQMLPGIERAIDGAHAGRVSEVTLAAPEAFGPRLSERIVELGRAELPEDAEVGDAYEAEDEHGHVVVLRVLDVDDERVVVDMNHPLAGQRVSFTLEVLDVRPATQAELREATLRAEAAPTGEPLISVEHLLRGGVKR